MKVKVYCPIGFAKRLSEEIINSGLTVTQISKRTKIARSSIYGYMYYGITPNVTHLAKICATIHVSADYLLFGKEG